MSEVEQEFHELWLGMVQPEGLVVSAPVLTQAQCYERQPPSLQRALISLCAHDSRSELVSPARILALPTFLEQLLGLGPDLWHAMAGYHPEVPWSGGLPESVAYYSEDGGQTMTPTLALRKLTSELDGLSDISEAGARYELLLWELPDGLDFDKVEAITGPWQYTPAAKFERLLRAARVPIGVLANGHVLRLIFAPPGESTGHIDFRVADMVTVGGRPILDAFMMLLHARRFFSVAEDRALPALLADSRKYQSEVTVQLGEQVRDALTILLRGFEAAAERDGRAMIDAALARDDDHLYQGLRAVLMRMVVVLYAEDLGLLPVEQSLYAEHYSLLGLFAQLQADHGAFPDSMSRRYGAWGRLVALFRALFTGVAAGELRMPERRGHLFDPNGFAFLEGWEAEGSAPIGSPKAQSEIRLPTLDDETLFEVLRKLILLDGQRLSYRALDVERIGSVYEVLTGYHVKRVESDAVCMRPEGVWLAADEMFEVAPAQREAWLADTIGLPKAQAKALAESVKGLRSGEKVFEVLEGYALGRTKEQRAAARASAGQLVLQPGPERRRTSSHYTPRSLSAQVVERALQPLLATMTRAGAEGPSSDRILQLRICDPAMGSGAFLAEACRYLGTALEAAWQREGTLPQHRNPTLAARRRVAQCCLYGVDKNSSAVELTKLSLWLLTLERERPFTFMDGCLRHGDSLVGLSLDQLRAFHWKPTQQLELYADAIGKELDEAIALRQRLHEMALSENGVNPDPREKELVLHDAEDALARMRLIADVCIGAFFSAEDDKARERERVRRFELVQRWLAEKDAKRRTTVEQELRGLQGELRRRQVPFHWMLEFPDVFWGSRPDPLEDGARNGAAFMDAFVGNPPFLGGTMISSKYGEQYLHWLATVAGRPGNRADLCAYFLLRARDLVGRHGLLGFVTTNTIAQGDTRELGLAFITAGNATISAAVTNLPWPGAAAVIVSIVHVAFGRVREVARPVLNGAEVVAIDSHLEPHAERSAASRLRSNATLCYLGVKIYGQGFLLTPAERDALVRKKPRNAERIRPYLGGEEINTNPTLSHDRYAIDFGQLGLEECKRWPELLAIVNERVKGERDRMPQSAAAKQLKKNWWRYFRPRLELYEAIAPLERCLVTSQVTKHLVFSFQPTDRIFSQKLCVFPLGNYTAFATLQSRVHEPWVWLLSSTLKADLNYSATDCFETFPFPTSDPRIALPGLEKSGKALYEARAAYMVATNRGLTKTYNALKDPGCRERDVLRMRELHEAMDRAVLEAYGWSDLKVPPFCAKDSAALAALERFEAEVIDRLYALNTERAAEETRLGLGAKPSKGAGKARSMKASVDRPKLRSVPPPPREAPSEPAIPKSARPGPANVRSVGRPGTMVAKKSAS